MTLNNPNVTLIVISPHDSTCLKFKHLDRLNSPNVVQFIRLLQKSQVFKSLQVLFFQNLTKANVYGRFVTFSLTNTVFFRSSGRDFSKISCTKIAFGKTFKHPTAKVVPIASALRGY
jgi:hypothetical protein